MATKPFQPDFEVPELLGGQGLPGQLVFPAERLVEVFVPVPIGRDDPVLGSGEAFLVQVGPPVGLVFGPDGGGRAVKGVEVLKRFGTREGSHGCVMIGGNKCHKIQADSGKVEVSLGKGFSIKIMGARDQK